MRISDWSSDVCSSDLRTQGQGAVDRVKAPAPSPAKAGGEEARLRTIGSRADERPPAVLAGRQGWGGVSFGSARTVGTPSQPPPAVAGGGAKAKARGFRRSCSNKAIGQATGRAKGWQYV